MSRSLNGLSANGNGNDGLSLLKPYNLGDLPNVGAALVNLGFTGNIPSQYKVASNGPIANNIVAYDSFGTVTCNKMRAIMSNGNSVVETSMGMGSNGVSWAGIDLNGSGPGSSEISIFSTSDLNGPGNFLVMNYSTSRTLFLCDKFGNFKLSPYGTLGMIDDTDMTITSHVIMNNGLKVDAIQSKTASGIVEFDSPVTMNNGLNVDVIRAIIRNAVIEFNSPVKLNHALDVDIIQSTIAARKIIYNSEIVMTSPLTIFCNSFNSYENRNSQLDATYNIGFNNNFLINIAALTTGKIITNTITSDTGCQIRTTSNVLVGGFDTSGNLLLQKNILAPNYVAWHLISGTAYNTVNYNIPWSLNDYLQPSTLFSSGSPAKIIIPVTGIYAMFCTFSITFLNTVSYTISLRRISNGETTNIDIVSEVYNTSGTRSMSLGTQAARLQANDEIIVRMGNFNGIDYIPRSWTGHLIAQLS